MSFFLCVCVCVCCLCVLCVCLCVHGGLYGVAKMSCNSDNHDSSKKYGVHVSQIFFIFHLFSSKNLARSRQYSSYLSFSFMFLQTSWLFSFSLFSLVVSYKVLYCRFCIQTRVTTRFIATETYLFCGPCFLSYRGYICTSIHTTTCLKEKIKK